MSGGFEPIKDRDKLNRKIRKDIIETGASIKDIAKRYIRSIIYHEPHLTKGDRYVEKIVVAMRAEDMSNIPTWIPESKTSYSDNEMDYATDMREVKWEDLKINEQICATPDEEIQSDSRRDKAFRGLRPSKAKTRPHPYEQIAQHRNSVGLMPRSRSSWEEICRRNGIQCPGVPGQLERWKEGGSDEKSIDG